MGTYDVGTYTRARADGQRAVDALRLARWIAEPKIDTPDYGRPVTLRRDGWDITLTVEYDEGMDLADLGYGTLEDGREDWRSGYVHPLDPAAIPTGNERGYGRFYVPAEARADRIAYYRRTGYAKAPALDAAMADEQAEMKRATDSYGPSVYVLDAKVSRQGITLGRASLGGIEIGWSDITRTDGSEYLAEVAEDIIPEAIAEAQAALERLAVSA